MSNSVEERNFPVVEEEQQRVERFLLLAAKKQIFHRLDIIDYRLYLIAQQLTVLICL